MWKIKICRQVALFKNRTGTYVYFEDAIKLFESEVNVRKSKQSKQYENKTSKGERTHSPIVNKNIQTEKTDLVFFIISSTAEI